MMRCSGLLLGLLPVAMGAGLQDDPIAADRVVYLDSSEGVKWTATSSAGARISIGIALSADLFSLLSGLCLPLRQV